MEHIPEPDKKDDEPGAFLRSEKEKDEAYLLECEAGLHPIDPDEVSDFQRWFESEPPAWIAVYDALGRGKPGR
jgi:hypothetical protein